MAKQGTFYFDDDAGALRPNSERPVWELPEGYAIAYPNCPQYPDVWCGPCLPPGHYLRWLEDMDEWDEEDWMLDAAAHGGDGAFQPTPAKLWRNRWRHHNTGKGKPVVFDWGGGVVIEQKRQAGF